MKNRNSWLQREKLKLVQIIINIKNKKLKLLIANGWKVELVQIVINIRCLGMLSFFLYNIYLFIFGECTAAILQLLHSLFEVFHNYSPLKMKFK